MAGYGIMFHHFWDDRHPKGQGAISADGLARIIEFVKVSHGGKQILSAEEWMERAVANRLLDDDVCLTFDDALLCQYEIALPVMESYGLTGFWFIYSSIFQGGREPLELYRYFRTIKFPDIDRFYSDFFGLVAQRFTSEWQHTQDDFNPDKYLAEFPFYTRNDRIFRYLRDRVLGSGYDEIMCELMRLHGFDPERVEGLWMQEKHLRTLHARGHVIGLHSHTHPTTLAKFPIERQREEYIRNHEYLARVLDAPPTTMSHPCNSYGPETLNLLRGMGIRLGFRSVMTPLANASILELPRQDHANVLKAMDRSALSVSH